MKNSQVGGSGYSRWWLQLPSHDEALVYAWKNDNQGPPASVDELDAALNAAQRGAADVLACAAEGARVASAARRLAATAARAEPCGTSAGAEMRVEARLVEARLV